jgi:hypothetical protein
MNSVQEFAETLGRFTSVCVDTALVTLPRSEFEHAQEARSAFLLLRGHARALQLLVDAGPHTYPSGWPIARSMLEVGLRTAWRMDHDDPMEAEARWVAWLGRFIEYERRNAKAMAAEGLTEFAEWATSRAEAAESVRRSMEDLLAQRGVKTPKGGPPMRQVMESLGLFAQRYQSYSEASEHQHGTAKDGSLLVASTHRHVRAFDRTDHVQDIGHPVACELPAVRAVRNLRTPVKAAR